MNSGRRFFPRSLFVFLLVLITLFILPVTLRLASAQRKTAAHKPSSSHAKVDAPANSADENDYSKKIKEYTTEKFFLTELVDHLPMSDTVPSPDKVLGYIVGTPNKLTYSKDLYRYYRELARTSKRVRLFTAPEKSEEGKEQILVAVGDEALLAKLDEGFDLVSGWKTHRRDPISRRAKSPRVSRSSASRSSSRLAPASASPAPA